MSFYNVEGHALGRNHRASWSGAVKHLDGVLEVLMNDERLRDHIPHSMAEIVADVDAAHQIYLAQLVTVVEADQSGTPRL